MTSDVKCLSSTFEFFDFSTEAVRSDINNKYRALMKKIGKSYDFINCGKEGVRSGINYKCRELMI